jgi:dynein heavy chain, axonemal
MLDLGRNLIKPRHYAILDVSEMLYHLLATGWVPGIFNNDEKMEILDVLKGETGMEKIENEKLWMNFQTTCVARMHVVMSLSRETLYALTQEYPQFLTFTMLDWYRPWNDDALRKVGQHYIANVKISKIL